MSEQQHGNLDVLSSPRRPDTLSSRERGLVHPERAGAQVLLLLGGDMPPHDGSLRITTSTILNLARNGFQRSEKVNKALTQDRNEYWSGISWDLRAWVEGEERADGTREPGLKDVLNHYQGKDGEKFLNRIGIDMQDQNAPYDVYNRFIRDQKSDVGYFVNTIMNSATPDEIRANKDVIVGLSQMYGEKAVELIGHLIDGMLNVRNPQQRESYAAEADVQIQDFYNSHSESRGILEKLTPSAKEPESPEEREARVAVERLREEAPEVEAIEPLLRKRNKSLLSLASLEDVDALFDIFKLSGSEKERLKQKLYKDHGATANTYVIEFIKHDNGKLELTGWGNDSRDPEALDDSPLLAHYLQDAVKNALTVDEKKEMLEKLERGKLLLPKKSMREALKMIFFSDDFLPRFEERYRELKDEDLCEYYFGKDDVNSLRKLHFI